MTATTINRRVSLRGWGPAPFGYIRCWDTKCPARRDPCTGRFAHAGAHLPPDDHGAGIMTAPANLLSYLTNHPNHCRVYARRTPSIPFHNGHPTCIGCGRAIRVREAMEYVAAHHPSPRVRSEHRAKLARWSEPLERAHALTNQGHGAVFTRPMRALGLAGKPTSTEAGAMRPALESLAADLGAYPHSAITANGNLRKQTTRMRKVECAECGYTARTTSKWLDYMGAPLCPCNGTEMERV